MRTNWVYILTNKPRGVFYVGSTSNPARRLEEHRAGEGSQHVRKYGLNRVVWFEAFADKGDALTIEHRMKKWARATKIEAVERGNSEWRDMSGEWLAEAAGTYDL